MPHPNDERIARLQAIAQIYGVLQGPQYQQDELALRQQQQQQYQALQLMQLQQQGQYQQGELAHANSALDLQSRDFDAKLQQQKDALATRSQDRSDALDERAYRTIASDPTLSPSHHHALAMATIDTGDGTFLQKYAKAVGQVDQSDAQNAWNTVAPAWGKMTPDAQAATFSGLVGKYPGFSSGSIDYSQGVAPSPISSSLPPTVAPTVSNQVGQLIGQGYGGEFSQYGDVAKLLGNYSVIPAYNFLSGIFGGQGTTPFKLTNDPNAQK